MAASKNNEALFPGNDDEKPICLKLYGRNESKCIEVDGWTRKLPRKFVDIKESLKIRTINSQTTAQDLPREFTKLISSCVKLNDLAIRASKRSKIPYPVIVHVYAKKSLEVICIDQSLLMFGCLIVGDDTGFCQLTVMNDAVYTLYEQVQVGDKLVIGVGVMNELRPNTDKRVCFDESNFLNLELKVTNYNCRHIFRIDQSCSSLKSRLLPPSYTKGRKLLTVSNLITPSLKSNQPRQGESETDHFDIIGVISHVGRLERYREFEKEVILKGGDNEDEVESIAFFKVYRWIELVDRNSSCAIPLRFYISHDTWNLQSSVVPGSLIIITNVQKQPGDFLHPSIASSRFSNMFINKEIASYMKYIPTALRQGVAQFLGNSNARVVLENAERIWTIGGAYATPFEDKDLFIKYFQEKGNRSPPLPSIRNLFHPNRTIRKRESSRLIFKGFIRQYCRFNDAGIKTFYRNMNEALSEELGTNYRELNHFSIAQPNNNWYMFSHRLPTIDLSRLTSDSSRKYSDTELYDILNVEYKKYCEPICMPAKGDVNLLKELPLLDCYPCLLIQIVNQSSDPFEQHMCIWKSSRYMSVEQMESKCKEALNSKSAIFMVDVQYIDDVNIQKDVKPVIEIILQDFTVCDTINMNNAVNNDTATTTPTEAVDNRNEIGDHHAVENMDEN